jgi:hypothetical protein
MGLILKFRKIKKPIDIIYRNVKLNTEHECILDIAVQYREIKEDGKDEISLFPFVMEAGDVEEKKRMAGNRLYRKEIYFC